MFTVAAFGKGVAETFLQEGEIGKLAIEPQKRKVDHIKKLHRCVQVTSRIREPSLRHASIDRYSMQSFSVTVTMDASYTSPRLVFMRVMLSRPKLSHNEYGTKNVLKNPIKITEKCRSINESAFELVGMRKLQGLFNTFVITTRMNEGVTSAPMALSCDTY